MNRIRIFVISFAILIIFIPGTAFADTFLASSTVTYTATREFNYAGPIGAMDFDINMTLQCETTYINTTDGALPPTSACHLNVTPSSASLTADYHFNRPSKDGSKTVPLSLNELSGLLGDSPPIPIPIGDPPVGTITVVLHGRLMAQNLTVTPQGSANPTSLSWSNWTPQDTVIAANSSPVTLQMDTAYELSFTITVSILPFPDVTRDSPSKQYSGNPSPTFVVAEFPSFLVLPLFTVTTLLAVIVYRRKRLYPRVR
jgi:hypothetical protein